ncbi:MAG: hypothetical protein WC584_04225 [Candidatus Pacearchaeota archaeon]
MKLKYFIKDKKKIYTLKDFADGKGTKDAHYKFIHLRSKKENENAQDSE